MVKVSPSETTATSATRTLMNCAPARSGTPKPEASAVGFSRITVTAVSGPVPAAL